MRPVLRVVPAEPSTEAAAAEGPSTWLRVVRGSPTDEELAALTAVLASLLASAKAEAATGRSTGLAPVPAAVHRRTGQAVPGREPLRVPRLSRARWGSQPAVREVWTTGAASARRRRAS